MTPDQPSPKEFRDALRALVGTCSVITTGTGDKATGLVVTSAISLSAEPPLLLACVNRSSSSWQVLKDSGIFGWSCLGAAHQSVAERFSGFGGVKGPARYDGAEWETAVTGARLLVGSPSAFDCTVEEMIDRATHSILIGRVQAIHSTPDAGALVYWHGGYRSL